jgi:glycosyltransferase involved in cell wall biosynthesis
MEVLIIDGGSQDDTVQIAKSFAENLQLRIIDAPGSSVYRALNIGLKIARGEFFVRVDARSFIPSNYIADCILRLDQALVKCAGGMQAQYGDSMVSHSIARVTASKLGTGGAKFRTATQSGFVDSVYLGVYRTATLRELGGFEDSSDYVSEDALINNRIRAQGGKIYLDVSLKVRYPAKASFRALIKQYVIYGAAKAFLLRKHHRLTSLRQVLPLIFLLSMIGFVLVSFMGLLPWGVFGAVFGIYVFLVVVGSYACFGIDGQPNGRLWARSVATMCIHLAWPIGFFLFLICPSLHKRIVSWLSE